MNLICGIDEAGRGPLAGPVTAAAVVLPPTFDTGQLGDSKKLSPRQRELVALELRRETIYGLGWATHYEIDAFNIHQATLIAMERAHNRLMRAISFLLQGNGANPTSMQRGSIDSNTPNSRPAWRKLLPWQELGLPPLVLVDGIHPPKLDYETRCVIGGDRLHPEIMAASILAKTARDRWMRAYAEIEPLYGYEQHKGYPTKNHKKLIALHGVSRIQRRSFRSI
ncbi:MAG: ribonuclease HII [Spirochaetaceae bacterium]|nr:MAG: ribonuclease HII [Spirochaetaceae bacterium]